VRVLVCGSTGCVGHAAVRALRSRGHEVIEGARGVSDGDRTLHVDFMEPRSPEAWAERLSARGIDAVVNCAGILMESRAQSFERIHALGPIELFRGAAKAGVRRIVQVSALGVGADDTGLAMPYLHSKLRADESLAALPIEWTVVRPSLVYGPRSQSAALFATLASLPLISLPGGGLYALQPIHVFELAEAIARRLEDKTAHREVLELGGAEALSYREMLARYREALGLGDALWMPVPMPLMKLAGRFAEALPQKVFCRDTMRLLERGSVPSRNATADLLGRAPSSLAHGLAITRPEPMLDLRVELAAPVAALMRVSLAFMWLYTAAISALLRDASGVMKLLERCGFEGDAGTAALVFSCTLNSALGLAVLLRPSARVHALQCAAIVGYTATAAWHMPELTIDHCGPLVKNLPVLAAVLLLWMSRTPRDGAHEKGASVSRRTPRLEAKKDEALSPSRTRPA